MSTTVKTGWLKDKNGDKFAPKTLTSQVQTSDGILIEDKIQADIEASLDSVNTLIDNIIDGTTKVGKATNADNAATATNAQHASQADADDNGDVISMTYETKSDASSKLAEAKQYADSSASTAANAVKNDLLNGAGTAYDTLKELGDLIDENQGAIEALGQVAAGKVPTSRTVNGKALDADITLSASDVGADASGSASSALASAQTYTDNAVAQKSQVQIITWEADD